MKKNIYIIFALLLGITSCTSEGKELRKKIREGNREYKKERYVDSEVEYRKALDEDLRSTEATFNLGNALYRQDKAEDALKQYKLVAENAESKKDKAKALHNIGNLFMNGQDYGNAIMTYRESLRNNPEDDETRYNLALAQYLYQEQEQDQDNQDQQQDQQEEEQEQNQQQDQQEQNQEEQEQEQEQHDSSQMSQEQAQQILDALMQDEKNTQEKVQLLEQQQMDKQKVDKNW